MLANINGSTGTVLCQIDALREGFASLGHQHVDDLSHPDVAFTFVGNGPYAPYVDLAKSGERKTIFNVLDLPIWCREWPEFKATWPAQLGAASKVTCISKTVQAQLKSELNIDAEVIYYPMKKVFPTIGGRYPFKVAMIGRVSDPEKFGTAAIQALIHAGFEEREVAIVGPEYCGWGTRLGIMSDEALNDLYNSVDYVIMLDRGAGIGLPAIEAACAGAIPIVAAHLATLQEFWVESPLGLNYQTLTSVDQISKFLRAIQNDREWKAALKQEILAYAMLKFKPKFDRIQVAKSLVGVFHQI